MPPGYQEELANSLGYGPSQGAVGKSAAGKDKGFGKDQKGGGGGKGYGKDQKGKVLAKANALSPCWRVLPLLWVRPLLPSLPHQARAGGCRASGEGICHCSSEGR